MKRTQVRGLLCLLIFSFCLVGISCQNKGDEEVVEPVPESEPEPEPELAPAPVTFAGNYVGGWWSNPPTERTYANEPASAIFRAGDSDTTWVGEFFFTRIFESCCGSGPNDGTLSFNLVDSVITNFKYMDIIPGCNGLFEGTGIINKSGTVIINFTGSDCEGEHEEARMEFTKD